MSGNEKSVVITASGKVVLQAAQTLWEKIEKALEEFDATVAYSNNAWTATNADRTQTDPAGSGGRFGRWVDAVNLAEAPTSTS